MMQLDNVKYLPSLCEDSMCTACCACFNACSNNAIEMKENEFGELHPYVNVDKCIGCGLCEKVCPELSSTIQRNNKPEIYYCWLNNSSDREKSTSGGVAYAISCAVINKGGHVWGAAFNADMECCYTEANNIEELRPIQKSKYVQSAVADCFRKIKEELRNGDLVLFAGTGCHVKGLRSYLRKDYPNLLTLDLVCHGVPGHGVFRKYKEWLENKYQDKLISFSFRPKREDGQEQGSYTLAIFQNKGDVKLELKNNGYFVGFQHNLFLRDNCYACQANGEERYSDFTVADFWGLGKIEPFKHNLQRSRGISMLALNSEKARGFFKEFADTLTYEKRTYKEASISNSQYYRSAIPSPRKDEFKRNLMVKSWEQLTEEYLQYSSKEKILFAIKKYTPPICYLMLNHWQNGSSKK